jgi:molybdopterin synthase catalytic subunit
MVRITQEPIDPREVARGVSGREVGGVATFFGTVRFQNAGKRVVAVEYHAYPAMAEKVLERIGEEMQRGFGALRFALVHRIGRLEVGEISLGVAAGAPHRREALGAVAYAVERVKQEAPIWKREIYTDGSAWLESALPAPREPAEDPGTRRKSGES